MNKVEFIARVRYLGWICYQMGANLPLHDVKDESFDISSDRLNSLCAGTEALLINLDITPEENHNIWMQYKANSGYVYGDTLDVERKTHPSMVPFEQLTDVEKHKDEMDILMVKLGEQLYNMLKQEDKESI